MTLIRKPRFINLLSTILYAKIAKTKRRQTTRVIYLLFSLSPDQSPTTKDPKTRRLPEDEEPARNVVTGITKAGPAAEVEPAATGPEVERVRRLPPLKC